MENFVKIKRILKNNGVFFDEMYLNDKLNIDSISMISLVLEFETEFNIELRDSDLIVENFETINAILQLLETYIDFEGGRK